MRWKIGPVLPKEIHEKLNYSEEEYFKNHSTAIESYMSELDLDLTVVCKLLSFDIFIFFIPSHGYLIRFNGGRYF